MAETPAIVLQVDWSGLAHRAIHRALQMNRSLVASAGAVAVAPPPRSDDWLVTLLDPIFQRGIARDKGQGVEQILILSDASVLGSVLPRLRPLMDAYDLSIRLCLPRQDIWLEEGYVEWALREDDRGTDEGLRAFLRDHIDDPLLDYVRAVHQCTEVVGTHKLDVLTWQEGDIVLEVFLRHAIRSGWRVRPSEVDQTQAAVIVPWSSIGYQLLRLLDVALLPSAAQPVLMDCLQQLCWRSGFRRRLLSGSEQDWVLGRFRAANRALAAEYGLPATAEDLFVAPEKDPVDHSDPLTDSDLLVRTLAEPLLDMLATRVVDGQTEAAKNPDAASDRTLAGLQEEIAVLRAQRDQLLRDIDRR
jgi:hypothetical protein